MTFETQEEIKKKLKKELGHDLIDDTERYNICFDSVLGKRKYFIK